jgi:hypothetical protein
MNTELRRIILNDDVRMYRSIFECMSNVVVIEVRSLARVPWPRTKGKTVHAACDQLTDGREGKGREGKGKSRIRIRIRHRKQKEEEKINTIGI